MMEILGNRGLMMMVLEMVNGNIYENGILELELEFKGLLVNREITKFHKNGQLKLNISFQNKEIRLMVDLSIGLKMEISSRRLLF